MLKPLLSGASFWGDRFRKTPFLTSREAARGRKCLSDALGCRSQMKSVFIQMQIGRIFLWARSTPRPIRSGPSVVRLSGLSWATTPTPERNTKESHLVRTLPLVYMPKIMTFKFAPIGCTVFNVKRNKKMKSFPPQCDYYNPVLNKQQWQWYKPSVRRTQHQHPDNDSQLGLWLRCHYSHISSNECTIINTDTTLPRPYLSVHCYTRTFIHSLTHSGEDNVLRSLINNLKSPAADQVSNSWGKMIRKHFYLLTCLMGGGYAICLNKHDTKRRGHMWS